MELRHLRYFVAVAEELHFGRAAERLLVAQPSLSRQIRQLEGELGVALLERTSRRVELTAAGRVFHDRALATLAQADEAGGAARRASAGQVGRLAVGFVASVAVEVLPDVVAEHRRQRPEVALHLREMTTEQQMPALLERRIDVGIGRDLEPVPGLRVAPMRRERLVVAVAREHPLHRRRRLGLRELRDDAFVHLPREQVPRAWDRIWSMCRRAGFVPARAMEGQQFVTLLALVAAGIGVAVVPESVRTLRRDRVAYIGIDDPEAWSEITVAVRAQGKNPVVPGFVELLLAVGR